MKFNKKKIQVIYRGCTTGSVIDSLGGKAGTMTGSNGISYNLCTTDL